MSKPGMTYDHEKIRKWFGISSIILFLVVIWMIVDDVQRDWKDYQREFYHIEKERVSKQIEGEKAKLDAEKKKQIEESIAQAEKDVSSKESDIDTLKAELAGLDKKIDVLETAVKAKKSEYDAVRYEAEEARHHGEEKKAEKLFAEMDELTRFMDETNLEIEALTSEREEKQSKLNAINKEFVVAQKRKKEFYTNLDKLKGQLKDVNLDSFVNTVRNLPLLDFFAPTIKVRQVVLNDIHQDLNFLEVASVDRCMTCHVAIDKPGFEYEKKWNEESKEWEVVKDENGTPVPMREPFRTHPNLELYMGPTSPHPIEKVGCTVCHFGQGNSIDFNWAGHMPPAGEEGEKVAKEWYKKYGWHPLSSTHWPTPILPGEYSQASCLRCHSESQEIPVLKTVDKVTGQPKVLGAHKLQEARDLIAKVGCYNCHKITGFENAEKVGPSLRRVSNKLTKNWAYQWIYNPKEVNKRSRMPQFFGHNIAETPEWSDYSNAEVQGIVEYLWKNSEAWEPERKGVHQSGSAKEGEKLFTTLGCRACHATSLAEWSLEKAQASADDEDEDDEEEDEDSAPVEKLAKGEYLGSEKIPAGPNLATVGLKVSSDWLFDWLKNPSHYSPNTVMPSLRLSDQEAADLVAYLMRRKAQKSDRKMKPVSAESMEYLLVQHLKSKEGVVGAKEKLAKMSHSEKLYLLGEKTIGRYGCYSCHDIKGFEGRLPIGASLTQHGTKNLLRFDFGFSDVPRTRYDWIANKIYEPSLYEKGKTFDYFSRGRMPKFHLEMEDAKLISMSIVGQVKDTISLEGKARLSAHAKLAEEGAQILSKYNCKSCHMIDWNNGGKLAKLMEDTTTSPPPLVQEGKKAQLDWLHGFLKSPSRIRPVVKVRMPTFPWKDGELNKVLNYFKHKEGMDTPFEPEHKYSSNTYDRAEAERIFKGLNCQLCHAKNSSEIPARLAKGGTVAPPLDLAYKRLRGEWIYEWIKNPATFYPGVVMPAFWNSTPLEGYHDRYKASSDRQLDKQLQSMTDYILSIGDPHR